MMAQMMQAQMMSDASFVAEQLPDVDPTTGRRPTLAIRQPKRRPAALVAAEEEEPGHASKRCKKLFDDYGSTLAGNLLASVKASARTEAEM